MKIKIEYKFEAGKTFPFKAVAWLDSTCLVGMSNFSFDEAKSDLIKDIKISVEKMPTVIPEPEEVEL